MEQRRRGKSVNHRSICRLIDASTPSLSVRPNMFYVKRLYFHLLAWVCALRVFARVRQTTPEGRSLISGTCSRCFSKTIAVLQPKARKMNPK